MGFFLILVAFVVAAPGAVGAQTRPSFFDVEGGGGYVMGGGAEDPGPSLATYDVGLAAWPTRSVGLAVRVVRGPGKDLHQPVAISDRTFYGPEKLSYTTCTVRYRSPVRGTWHSEVGA